MRLDSNISALGEENQQKLQHSSVHIPSDLDSLTIDYLTLYLTGLGFGEIVRDVKNSPLSQFIDENNMFTSISYDSKTQAKPEHETIFQTQLLLPQKSFSALNGALYAQLLLDHYILDEKTKQLHTRLGIFAKSYELPALTPNTKFKSATLIGAGGIGTYVALSLALDMHAEKLNLERLHIIDPDVVENKNLNRQCLYTEHVGLPKATALRDELYKICSPKKTSITATSEYVTSDSISQLLDPDVKLAKQYGDSHAILCCTDNAQSRYIVSKFCEEQNIRFLEAGCTTKLSIVSQYSPFVTHTKHSPVHVQRGYSPPFTQIRTSCTTANPSVVIPNAIAGNLLAALTYDSEFNRMIKYDPSLHKPFFEVKL
jgi:hypothetical protein